MVKGFKLSLETEIVRALRISSMWLYKREIGRIGDRGRKVHGIRLGQSEGGPPFICT